LLEFSLTEPLGDDLTWVHLVVVGSSGLLGALLSFKLVAIMLKSITAFLGAFFTVSGGAHFYAEGTSEDVWLSPESFFDDSDNRESHVKQCELFCVGCYLLWFMFFVTGAWFQHRGKNLCKNDKQEKEKQSGKQVEMRGRPIRGIPVDSDSDSQEYM